MGVALPLSSAAAAAAAVDRDWGLHPGFIGPAGDYYNQCSLSPECWIIDRDIGEVRAWFNTYVKDQ